ncbi:MAG: hypothetical protein AAB134_06220, partial [Pseudomonadota bacterium]
LNSTVTGQVQVKVLTPAAKSAHGSAILAAPVAKPANVHSLKPKVAAQKANAAGGGWTEF